MCEVPNSMNRIEDPGPDDRGSQAKNCDLLPPGVFGPIDISTGLFEMGASPGSVCGSREQNHLMERRGPMITACINPGCDARC